MRSVDYDKINRTSNPCRLQKMEYGDSDYNVCGCVSDYCHTLDVKQLIDSGEFILISTSQAGDRSSFYVKGAVSLDKEKQTNDCQRSNASFVLIDQQTLVDHTHDAFELGDKHLVPSGSKSINATTCRMNHLSVETVAFLRPDRMVLVILQNKSEKMANIDVFDGLVGTIRVPLKSKSINALIYSKKS